MNCGYPIHHAISRKPFLNELVYGFPTNPNKITNDQEKILKLLKKWTDGLSEKNRNACDFGYIRQMYCLLKGRGFKFPLVSQEEIDAFGNSIGKIFTKEELEAERQIVHQTKLQEHLSKGTNSDLNAANELIKILCDSESKESDLLESKIMDQLNLLSNKIDKLENWPNNNNEIENDQVGIENTNSNSDQIYQTCYDECRASIPALHRLANSELNSSTMCKLIHFHPSSTSYSSLHLHSTPLPILFLLFSQIIGNQRETA